MSAVRDTSATSHAIASAVVRDASNVSRTLVGMMVRDANGLHSVLTGGGSSAYSADPTDVSGSGYSKTTINVTTNTTTVTAPTGSTFAWTFEDTGWTATAPSSATSAFTSRVAPGQDKSTTAICTVTYQGQTHVVNVNADVSNNYGGLN